LKIRGFLGSSNVLSTVNYDCEDTINLYPEMDLLGDAKEQEVVMLRQRPGLTLLHTIPRSPIRFIYQTANNYIYVVAGNGVYQLKTTDGTNYTHTLIATLTTSTGPVCIVDGIPNVVNGQLNTARVNQVVIVDGSTTGISFTENLTKITLLTSGNGFNGSAFVTFQDGFFLFSQPNTPVVQFASDPLNISSSDTIVVNLGSDNIARVLCDHDIVWCFGYRTTSVWQNTGGVGYFSPNNLFSQIPGSFSQGGVFPNTVCQLSGQLIWLQTDPNGCAQIFEAFGYRGTRISNHGIELALSTAGDLTNSTAWGYQSQGHTFYCINVPGLPYTICYDIITRMWHKRVYSNSGVLSRDLVEYHFNVNLPGIGQFSIAGDYSNGNLYKVDENNYSDNGQPIFKQRTTPHISAEYKRMVFNKVQVDLEGGTGLTGLGFPFVQGNTGSPVQKTATNVELSGNGPSYYFTGNDGTSVTPTNTPTITASGTYSGSYTLNGNGIIVNPGPLSVPLSQFALGNGSTTSFNLSNNTGTNISSALVYSSDWRGNNLQTTTPRTNLAAYSIDFNKQWVSTGVNANPATSTTTGSTSSAVTTINVPSTNSPTANSQGMTVQAGWNTLSYNSLITSRPISFAAQDVSGTYTTYGTGIPSGSSTTIATSSTTNYITGTVSGTVEGDSGNNATSAVGIHNGSSMIFSSFGGANSYLTNITGTLFIAITTSTTQSAITNTASVACGEIDVQYKVDSMTSWVTILTGVGANDLTATNPISVNLTIKNLNTLQVRILQTAQPFYTNMENVWYPNSAPGFTDSFTIYDMAFVGGISYALNAPDGSSTGTALVEDGSNGYHGISTQYTSIANEYSTFSIYAVPGDPTRNIQLQLGSGTTIAAQAQFNLQSGTIVGSVSGNNASFNVTNYSQAIPSTGVILVNTLVSSYLTGITAQIQPSVLQTPTNGNIITYAWSFISGNGATITTSSTLPNITFNVGAPGNLLLQCVITVNDVPTIYTQYVTVANTTNIWRLSITGKEYVSGNSTAAINLVNTAYPLTYNNPPTTWDTALLSDGVYRPVYSTEPWNTPGPLSYNTVAPSVCSPGAELVATFAYYNGDYSYAWSISPTSAATITTPTTGGNPTVKFTAGNVGSFAIICKVTGTIDITSSQVITVIPSMKVYYPGNNGSGWIGIWGAQIETYTTATQPTPLINTVGTPLTDLVTINATTGNVLFGVAPLDDAVLTATFSITATSLEPVQYYATFQYQEADPTYIYLGVNPQVSLEYSIDGGHTWSNPVPMPIGAIGSYLSRCVWTRLGMSRDRVFRITCADPVKFTLLGESFEVNVGNS
jgi:hypothetical protein